MLYWNVCGGNVNALTAIKNMKFFFFSTYSMIDSITIWNLEVGVVMYIENTMIFVDKKYFFFEKLKWDSKFYWHQTNVRKVKFLVLH